MTADRSLTVAARLRLLLGEHGGLPGTSYLGIPDPFDFPERKGRSISRSGGPLDSSEGRPRRALVRPPEAVAEAVAVSTAKLTGSTLAKLPRISLE